MPSSPANIQMLIIVIVHILLTSWLKPDASAQLKPISRGNVKVGQHLLSPIGFGTWSWGNRFLWNYNTDDDGELQRCFDAANKAAAGRGGTQWWDTGDTYGTGKLKGRAETLLGQFGKSSVNSRSLFATKLAPFPTRIGRDSMYSAALASSERLGKSKIDIVQLHWPPYCIVPQLNEWYESEYLAAFERLVREGRATQIGVSNYGPRTLKRASAVAQSLGIPIYSNQVQFSMLSRYPIENGLDEVCAGLGIQPIGYSPLALGLLTDKYRQDKLPLGVRGLLFKEYLPRISGLLDVLRDIATKRRKSMAQIVLNWNLQKGFLLLVGVRSVAQVKENLGALGWSLTPGEVEEIDRAARRCPQLIQNSFQTD